MTARVKNGKGFFVHPYNKRFGWRTGKDIKAGKSIRKDEDGYERFEDYFSESESDADLTKSVLRYEEFSKTKENVENNAVDGEEEEKEEVFVKGEKVLASVNNQLKNAKHSVNTCSMNQRKDSEDVNPVAWLRNKNVGRRTGRNVKAGKNIRKDKDGYEMFEDYWSESDADSFLSHSSTSSKRSVKANKTVLKPLKNIRPMHSSTFREGENPVAWIKNKNIGRRTGKDVKSGKNIRRDSCGYERFEDYWSESDADSLMVSRISVSELNKSKTILTKSESSEKASDSHKNHKEAEAISTYESDNSQATQKSQEILTDNSDSQETITDQADCQNSAYIKLSQVSEEDEESQDLASSQKQRIGTEEVQVNGTDQVATPTSDQINETFEKRKTRSSSRLKNSTAAKEKTATRSSKSRKSSNNVSQKYKSDNDTPQRSVVISDKDVSMSTTDLVDIDHSKSKHLSPEKDAELLSGVSDKSILSQKEQSSKKQKVSDKAQSLDFQSNSEVEESSELHQKIHIEHVKNISENIIQPTEDILAEATDNSRSVANSLSKTRTEFENLQHESIIEETHSKNNISEGHVTLKEKDCKKGVNRNESSCVQKSPVESNDAFNTKSKNCNETSERLSSVKTNKRSKNDFGNVSKNSRQVKSTVHSEYSENSSLSDEETLKIQSKSNSEEILNKKESTRRSSPVQNTESVINKSKVLDKPPMQNKDTAVNENEENSKDKNQEVEVRTKTGINSPKLKKLTSRQNLTAIQRTVVHEETPKLSQTVPVLNQDKDGIPINIGGNVTGSITRGEGQILQTTGSTPLVSFKTRKRLSYSVADETINLTRPRRQSDPTSDSTIRVEKAVSRKSQISRKSHNLRKSLMTSLFNDKESDSDASVGFLSLAVTSNNENKMNLSQEEEEIVIVENDVLIDKEKERDVPNAVDKGRQSLVLKKRQSVKGGRNQRKSEVSKQDEVKVDKRRSRKQSNVSVQKREKDIHVESADDEYSLQKTIQSGREQKRKSEVKQNLEKHFDEDTGQDQLKKNNNKKGTKGRKKGKKKKNQKKGNNQKKTNDKKESDKESELNNVLQNDVQIESERDNEHVIHEIDNHENYHDCETGHDPDGLKSLSKKKHNLKKKSFMFEESEIESIDSLPAEDNENANKNSKLIENSDGKENVKERKSSIYASDAVEESEEIKPSNTNKSVSKQKNNSSVILSPLSEPKRRKSCANLTVGSIKTRKRKMSHRNTRQSNKTISEGEKLSESTTLNNRPFDVDADEARKKQPRKGRNSKVNTLSELNVDKSTNITSSSISRKSDNESDTDSKVNKRKSSQGRRSKRSTNSTENTEDNIDVSPAKKGPKVSVSDTPVCLRTSFNEYETPNQFEVSNIEQVFQSGISFRQRAYTSEVLSPTNNLSSPPDEANNDISSAGVPNGEGIALQFHPVVSEGASPSLTPCLVKPGVSRKSKGRHVTINNFPTQQSFTANYSGDSLGDETALTANTVTSSDITSSTPLHIFEMTSTETPIPVVAPKKPRIIYPPPNPEGLRRSQRTRVKPLAWHKNERIIYERRKSGLVVSGIQPSVVECKILEKEAKKKAKLKKKRKFKGRPVTKSPARNLSMHVDLPVDMNVTISNSVPVINPDTNQEVLLECVGTKDMCVYVGPTGEEPRMSDPYIMSRIIDHSGIGNGFLLIRPKQEKPEQFLTAGSLMFILLRGKVSVTIHRCSSILEAEDTFLVPRGNKYSIKNLRSDSDAKLFYTVIKDPDTDSEEEENEQAQRNSNISFNTTY